jgi:integrase
MQFREAAEQYIENLLLENGRNIPMKARQLKQGLIPFFGEMELASIRRMDVERFKRHMLEKGFAPATINRYTAVLSNMFHKGIEWEWLERIPCRVVKLPETNIRTTYLSPEEISTLLEAAKADKSPIVEPFIRIALGTAMRRTEILSIRVEEIDCHNREIYIPKAKCGARVQPMTASLATYLDNYLRKKVFSDQEYLFPSLTSASGHREEIERPFRRVVKRAGLDPKTVCRHTLRHTAITHLVQAGVDLPTVQRFSGHKTIQMVFRYSHQSKDHLHWALDQMDSRLSGPMASSSR